MHPLRASTFVLLILVLTAMLDPTMAMAGSNRASSSTGKTSAKSRLWTNIKRILYGRPVERPQATILPYIENIMQKHDWEKFKAVWDEAVKNKWLDDHIDDLLPSSDGHIFHVGFGFILGRYPNDKSDRIPRLLNFTNGSPCLKRSHLSQD
ncbi:hypothetical protein [Sporisorium scitamineum]|uniref:Uncharacterized protein n=1 Tax=Sporisorium scitamineum TaxID=49012 RepID=A0A0F7SCA9_9BASI|nr:hypothetical protein [Sporisorium scitamineum]